VQVSQYAWASKERFCKGLAGTGLERASKVTLVLIILLLLLLFGGGAFYLTNNLLLVIIIVVIVLALSGYGGRGRWR